MPQSSRRRTLSLPLSFPLSMSTTSQFLTLLIEDALSPFPTTEIGRKVEIDVTPTSIQAHSPVNRSENILHSLARAFPDAGTHVAFVDEFIQRESWVFDGSIFQRVESTSTTWASVEQGILIEWPEPQSMACVHADMATWFTMLSACLHSGEVLSVAIEGEDALELHAECQGESEEEGSSLIRRSLASIAIDGPSPRNVGSCVGKIPKASSRLTLTHGAYLPTRVVVVAALRPEQQGLNIHTFHNDLPTTSPVLITLVHDQTVQFAWHEYGIGIESTASPQQFSLAADQDVQITCIHIFIHVWTQARDLHERDLPVEDTGLAIVWGRHLRGGMKRALDQIRVSNHELFGDTKEARARRATARWIPSAATSMASIVASMGPAMKARCLTIAGASDPADLQRIVAERAIDGCEKRALDTRVRRVVARGAPRQARDTYAEEDDPEDLAGEVRLSMTGTGTLPHQSDSDDDASMSDSLGWGLP